jgi:hypothetical protein
MRRALIAVACCVGLFLTAAVAVAVAPTRPVSAAHASRSRSISASQPPVLAYYYIWFDTRSWRRAKTDYPLVGRYSSDNPVVMREQIRLAKRAGIDGFIVSWKDTPTLDRRLEQLIGIAEAEHFKLAIIYQGLDFHRRPLPIQTVAHDLWFFTATFAHRTPFQLFAKPTVIWSGTWEFSAADIARATGPVRSTVSVLGSEKNVDGYRRIAPWVDGDAYYWSSVNPATYKGYIEKLTDLGNAVHDDLGRWIAPAAVGFDARKVGGTTVVGRDGGANLLTQIDAALASSPDALGLISWNEYSENSHLEPSLNYGHRALDVVGERLGSGAVGSVTVHSARVGTRASEASSSRPNPAPPTGFSGPMALAVCGALFGALVFVGVLRARRTPRLRIVGVTGDPARRGHGAESVIGSPSRREVVATRRRQRRRPSGS